MLPSSLLVTRRRLDKIRPAFAQIDEANLKIARILIQTYTDHVGKKKEKLNEAVTSIEEIASDYRYVRGLAALLDRRCRLEPETELPPVEVRRIVFKTAFSEGTPTAPEERQAILKQVAETLNTGVRELEESLYGDLEDSLLLKDFKPPNPERLLKQYNLSLTQTLLFSSTELTFTTEGNWQHIFRQISWLGLIYTIRKEGSQYEVRVDGPVSLFKLNRRYGTNLAKLLPAIVQNKFWHLKAKILQGKGERRLLNFELDSEKHGEIVEALTKPMDPNIFDSQVEETFAKLFQALKTGWELKREPEPIPVGKHVMIPDFLLQKSGLKVFLEVVGFWTPQYLKEKVKKLEMLSNVNMVLAVNHSLACQKIEELKDKLNIIYYKSTIPLKPVITYLKREEDKLMNEQVKQLLAKPFLYDHPIVEAKETAEKMGVTVKAVKESWKRRRLHGYINLGDTLVAETKLNEIRCEIKSRLKQRPELNLVEATEILEASGVKKASNILNVLGFEIVWCSIDPNTAKIRIKTESNSN